MAASLDTSAMDQVIGYRLRRAMAYVFHQFAERFAEADIRPAEYSILVLIADNPGCTQTALAEALGIKRANFVGLVQGLEKRGLITRRHQSGDRRAHALHLSPEGEEFVDEIRVIQDDFERHCIRLLGSEADRDTLMRLLDRLSGGKDAAST